MGLTRKQILIVVILLSGTLLAVLNQTLLSPALPAIMADTQVDATTVQWLTSAYSLVEAVVIPLSAYLIGRFPTKKLFIFGMSIFAIGSFLAAIAPVFAVLLLGRMCQAVATGIAMPMVFTVILLIFPREKRGSAMGIVSLAIGFAPAIGPSISGLLVDSVGWRALFLLVCVLAVVIVLFAILLLESYGEFEPTSFDKPSVVLCSLGLLSLLYGLSSITSAEVIALPLALIVVGVILLIFFVLYVHASSFPSVKITLLYNERQLFVKLSLTGAQLRVAKNQVVNVHLRPSFTKLRMYHSMQAGAEYACLFKNQHGQMQGVKEPGKSIHRCKAPGYHQLGAPLQVVQPVCMLGQKIPPRADQPVCEGQAHQSPMGVAGQDQVRPGLGIAFRQVIAVGQEDHKALLPGLGPDLFQQSLGRFHVDVPVGVLHAGQDQAVSAPFQDHIAVVQGLDPQLLHNAVQAGKFR